MRAPCVIFSLIGLYLSVLLIQLQTNSASVPALAIDICDRVGGCDQVLESKWAYLPPVEQPAVGEEPTLLQEYAIPVAVLGLAYFSGLLIWYLFIGRASTVANTIVLIVGLLSCLVSAWYLYLIFRVLDSACPFCLILHFVNFLLFGATVAYFFREDTGAYQPRALYGATCLAILSLWMAVGFGWRHRSERLQNEALTQSLAAMQSNIDLVEMVWRAEKPVEIPIREVASRLSQTHFDPILHAAPGFRHPVVIAGNPLDPACVGISTFVLDRVRPHFAGHLRVVWKHYPTGDLRSPQWMAARALEAARLQGKFWPFLRLVFEHREQMDQIDYPALAADCGLNVEQFDRDWRSSAVQVRIQSDLAAMKQLGIDRTPQVFLNSRPVDESIAGLMGFWKLQAVKLKTLRNQKGQGWGSRGTEGLATHGESSTGVP